MLDRVILHADLLAAIDQLAPRRRIVGPVARHVPECTPPLRYFYQEVARAAELDLKFSYTVYSPKEALLPSRETLFTFRREAHGFHATPVFDRRPRALIGVHPCDIHAIELLDRVFQDDYDDEHYRVRRENTLVVGVDCPQPCTRDVFCREMGANHAETGMDVMLYPLHGAEGNGDGGGDLRFGVKFGSEAGKAWLCDPSLAKRLEFPSAQDERLFERYLRDKAQAFEPVLTVTGAELPVILDHSYDSLLWEATARRCYSCGSCNLVCPTCYCFDIQDCGDLDPQEGERVRAWDACQLESFAAVAGGHNFRARPAQRLRHRIYRKAKWIQERTGLSGCVGCGRCDRACTAKIRCVEIYNQLAEERPR